MAARKNIRARAALWTLPILAAVAGGLALGRPWRSGPVTVEALLQERFEPVAHPAPAIPYDIEGASPSERAVLEFIARAPATEQVRMDIALHNLAVSRNRFGTKGSEFLIRNSALKQRVLGLITHQRVNAADAAEAIAGLRDSQEVHRRYLDLPPSMLTGSHTWHRAWMSVYEDWIAQLQAKAGLAPPSEPAPR